MSRWRAIVRAELENILESGTRNVTLEELQTKLRPRLETEFPDNDHIDAGLRRTIQELRDEGDVEFLGDGKYRLTLERSAPLAELFEDALREYPEAKAQGDRGHRAATLIDDRIPQELSNVLDYDHISVKSSVGSGTMANIPWIGVFDTRLTTTPQEGFYVVYLLDSEAETVFLTLNQGMTRLQDEYGRPAAREILSARAEALRTVVTVRGFENDEITLTEDLLTSRNSLYGVSTVCYRAYELGEFPESSIWIEDISQLVSEYQRLIEEDVFADLLNAFHEETLEQENPFQGGEAHPPAGEYEGVTEAMEDVLERLSESDINREVFTRKLSKAIVTEWTEPLTQIAVQTASEISPDQEVLIDQIKSVYYTNEEWLSDTANTLGIGSLYDLAPPQVLYMVLLRELQEGISDISQVNVNHVKLKTIFNNEYTVVGEEDEDAEDIEHVLLTILDAPSGQRAVHHCTGPPEYWLTALRRRAISFSENDKNRWQRVNPGDIVLLHSKAESSIDGIEMQPNGFIAAGILGEKFETSANDWWWDEIQQDESFPLLVSFDRLFVTSAMENIDETTTISRQSLGEIAEEISAVTARPLDFSEADALCRDQTGSGLASQGSFSTFKTEGGELEYERPRVILKNLAPLLSEIGPVNIHRTTNPTLSPDLLEGLYFPDDQARQILAEIEAALRSGKHIILTGPPGTGKTEIAKQVVAELARMNPHLYTGTQITTATADWSTFDTVGGYMPSESAADGAGEDLTFTPGTILNRLRDRQGDVPVNEPVVIDELNRADIDKAFGQLFTVLSGQPVTLPYTKDGQEIEILPAKILDEPIRYHQYAIPNSWRIFATMNTYDKTSLYEMSYAFMRRFAFIRVGAPDLTGDLVPLLENYVDAWETTDIEIDLDPEELRAVGEVWRQTNAEVEHRAIGPAIIRDIVLYLDNHSTADLPERLTRAVIAYVFPQLEGVPRRHRIVDNVASVGEHAIEPDHLRAVAEEMLQVTFEED